MQKEVEAAASCATEGDGFSVGTSVRWALLLQQQLSLIQAEQKKCESHCQALGEHTRALKRELEDVDPSNRLVHQRPVPTTLPPLSDSGDTPCVGATGGSPSSDHSATRLPPEEEMLLSTPNLNSLSKFLEEIPDSPIEASASMPSQPQGVMPRILTPQHLQRMHRAVSAPDRSGGPPGPAVQRSCKGGSATLGPFDALAGAHR